MMRGSIEGERQLENYRRQGPLSRPYRFDRDIGPNLQWYIAILRSPKLAMARVSLRIADDWLAHH